MKFKVNFYYIGLFLLTLTLVAYISIDYFSKSNNTDLIFKGFSTINNSYKNLSENSNYDMDNVSDITENNLSILKSLKSSNKDFNLIISKYDDYFSKLSSLKENKSDKSNYSALLSSSLESLNSINSYYLNSTLASNIKNFNLFYNYNKNFLNKEILEYKKYLNADITNSISNDYYLSMSSLYRRLSDICQDLKPALERCYENKTSVNNILNDIYIKQSNILTLRKDLSTLSIPSDSYSTFEEFQNLINLSSVYLSSMRDVLVSESESPSFDKNLEVIYENPFSKYEDISISLSEYADIHSSLIR